MPDGMKSSGTTRSDGQNGWQSNKAGGRLMISAKESGNKGVSDGRNFRKGIQGKQGSSKGARNTGG
jgi:hypothetical protein